MVLNEVKKLVDLSECPKYFFWLPTTCKKFYRLQNDIELSYIGVFKNPWTLFLSLENFLELLQVQKNCLGISDTLGALEKVLEDYLQAWQTFESFNQDKVDVNIAES